LFFLNDSGEHFWLRNKARSFIAKQIERHPHNENYQYLEMKAFGRYKRVYKAVANDSAR
jgi:hypothetical protein